MTRAVKYILNANCKSIVYHDLMYFLHNMAKSINVQHIVFTLDSANIDKCEINNLKRRYSHYGQSTSFIFNQHAIKIIKDMFIYCWRSIYSVSFTNNKLMCVGLMSYMDKYVYCGIDSDVTCKIDQVINFMFYGSAIYSTRLYGRNRDGTIREVINSDVHIIDDFYDRLVNNDLLHIIHHIFFLNNFGLICDITGLIKQILIDSLF